MNSPLQGGKRRRRLPRLRPAVLVLLALVAIGGGAFALVRDSSDGGDAGASPALVPPLELGKKHRRQLERMARGELPRRLPPGVTITGPNAVRVKLGPKPKSAILFDLENGHVLWRLKPMRVRPIASLTKIMTALLVAERLPYDATARITKAAVRYTGSMVGVLPRGKRVKVQALMYGMMLPSGNDAAVALAGRIAGSDRRFARLMTRRARQLGLSCTKFVSSYGLQDGNRSCAADLAALTRRVMDQPRIAHVVRHEHVNIRFPQIKGRHLDLRNTNPLLQTGYRGAIGLKTGYTYPAGRCFIGVARRGGRTLGVVLLDSADTGGQAAQLLDAGFRATARGRG